MLMRMQVVADLCILTISLQRQQCNACVIIAYALQGQPRIVLFNDDDLEHKNIALARPIYPVFWYMSPLPFIFFPRYFWINTGTSLHQTCNMETQIKGGTKTVGQELVSYDP